MNAPMNAPSPARTRLFRHSVLRLRTAFSLLITLSTLGAISALSLATSSCTSVYGTRRDYFGYRNTLPQTQTLDGQQQAQNGDWSNPYAQNGQNGQNMQNGQNIQNAAQTQVVFVPVITPWYNQVSFYGGFSNRWIRPLGWNAWGTGVWADPWGFNTFSTFGVGVGFGSFNRWNRWNNWAAWDSWNGGWGGGWGGGWNNGWGGGWNGGWGDPWAFNSFNSWYCPSYVGGWGGWGAAFNPYFGYSGFRPNRGGWWGNNINSINNANGWNGVNADANTRAVPLRDYGVQRQYTASNAGNFTSSNAATAPYMGQFDGGGASGGRSRNGAPVSSAPTARPYYDPSALGGANTNNGSGSGWWSGGATKSGGGSYNGNAVQSYPQNNSQSQPQAAPSRSNSSGSWWNGGATKSGGGGNYNSGGGSYNGGATKSGGGGSYNSGGGSYNGGATKSGGGGSYNSGGGSYNGGATKSGGGGGRNRD
jgi:hypothetical protein